MQAEAVNPETGERFTIEISPEAWDQLVCDARPRLSKKILERCIDNLPVSADAKVHLASFMSATVKIGNAVLNIGRRILEVVFDLVKRYPQFTFAVVMHLVGSLLAVFVPALAPVLVPLLKAMELVFALVKDHLEGRKSLKNEPIWREARKAIQPFEALKAAA